MALIDIFWKKPVAQISDPGIIKINEQLEEIRERLYRMENKQKETSLQLEEIDDFLQTGGSETVLINALIEVSDTIGDFFYFTAADFNSPLFEQAQMMWNTAKKTAEAAGLIIIDTSNEAFDFHLHSAESTEQNYDLPNGFVLHTLKCGYIYKDEVIRRAAVVINKIN